jgi:hypothetical protein
MTAQQSVGNRRETIMRDVADLVSLTTSTVPRVGIRATVVVRLASAGNATEAIDA